MHTKVCPNHLCSVSLAQLNIQSLQHIQNLEGAKQALRGHGSVISGLLNKNCDFVEDLLENGIVKFKVLMEVRKASSRISTDPQLQENRV